MAYNEELSIKVQLKPDEGKSKGNINDFIKEINQKNNLNKIKLDLDLNKTGKTIQKLDKELAKVGANFKDAFAVSPTTIRGLQQMEKTFKAFTKMNKASQKALHGYFQDAEKGVQGVKTQAKQLEQVLDSATRSTHNVGKEFNKETVKIVKYMDSGLQGIKAQIVERQNLRDSLMTTVYGDGRAVRKQISDVESANKKILSEYNKTFKGINKLEENYRKVSLNGDLEAQRVVSQALERQYNKLAKLDKQVADLGIGDKIKGDLDEIVKLSNADFKVKMSTIDDRLAKQQLAEQKRNDKKQEQEDKKADRENLNTQKENIRNLLAEYKRLSNQKSSLLKQSVGTSISDGGYNALQGHLKGVQRELDKTSLELLKYGGNLTKALDSNSALKGSQDTIRVLEKISKKVLSTTNDLKKLSNSSYVDERALGGILETLEAISHIDADASVEDLVTALKQLDAIQSKMSSVKTDIADSKNYEKASDFIEDYMQKLRRLQRESGQYLNPLAVDEFVNSLQRLNSVSLDKLGHEQKQITRNFRDMTDEIKHVQHEVENGFFANLYDNLASFQLGDVIGDAIRESVYAVVQGVRDFDSAIRDYRKVAVESWIDTPGELKQIGTDAIQIAKQVGMSSNDVVLAMADTIQAGIGKTKKDIEEVSKMSMMLANVGDVSQEQASQYFNSILSAFQYSDGKSWASKPLKEIEVFVDGAVKKTTQLEKVTDILNYVGNEYSITSSGIAEALMRSGSVMSTYGVSYEQAVAMITGANNSIQNPEKIGNGLKTITMRMAGLTYKTKEGKIALNSTGDALQKIAKIELIDEKTGKLKNVFQMVDELKDKWSSLTEQEQRALTEAMAGKQQANIMASLLNNWSTVEDVMGNISDSSANFFGSATKENAQYMDSIEGKINKLKETWKETYTTIITSDFAKGVLDIAISVSEAITKLVQSIDKAKLTIPALALAFLNLKNSMVFLGTGGRRGSVGGIFSGGIFDGSNWRRFGSEIKKSGNAIDGLEKATSNLKGTNVNLGTTMNNLSGGIGTVVTTTGQATGKMSGLGKGLKLALSSINPMNIALGLFSGVLQGVAIWGIGKLIQKTGEWAYANHNARVELNESTKASKEELKTLEYKQESLSKVAKRYDELKNKTKLTVDESDELKKVTNELAQLFPELQAPNYDPNNPILLTTKDAKDLQAELDRAIKKQKELLHSNLESNADISRDKLNNHDDNKFDKSLNQKIADARKLYEDAMMHRDYATNKMSNDLSDPYNFGKKLLGNVAELRENFEAKKKETEKYYNEYAKLVQEREKEINVLRKEAYSEMENNFNWSGLKKEQQTALQGIVKGLDLSGVDSSKAESMLNKMVELTKKGKFNAEQFGTQLQSVQDEFSKTHNIGDYARNIQSLVTEFSKMTGLKPEEVRKLFNISDVVDLASDGLEQFLGTYDKTVESISSGDKISINLATQFQAVDDMLGDLLDETNLDINEKTGNVTLKIDVATEIANSKDVPKDIREMAQEIIKDGEVSTDEYKFLMQLGIAFQKGKSGEGEVDKIVADFQKKFDVKKPKVKVDTNKAKKDIDEVNNKKINDKTVNVKGNNKDALSKTKTVKDYVRGVKDKFFSITASNKSAVDKAKEVLNLRSQIKNKAFTITANIIKSGAKFLWDMVTAKSNPGRQSMSVHVRPDGSIFSNSTQSTQVIASGVTSPGTMTFGGTSASPTMNFGGGSAVNTTGMTASGVSSFATKKTTPKYTPPDDVYFNEIDWLIRAIDLQKQLENAISRVNSQLEINRDKQKYAYGSSKITLMREEVSLLQQQVALNQQLQSSLKNEQGSLKNFLGKKGFKFDSTGNLTNYVAKMQELDNWIKGSKSEAEYESRTKQVSEIKSALEEYMNVTFTQIPQAQQEWQGLSNSIKDAYVEQLQASKEVEDKIIEMYKKQIDEKKKAIQEDLKLTEDALDKKIDAINKEKEAYNKAREEDNWQDEYIKKQEEMLKLREKMNLLSRDKSSEGLSKYEDVKKQYEEALEDVNKMVKDKADQQVNELFDSEADKLQKEKELAQAQAEAKTDVIDKAYTDENLRQMANVDIISGTFTDLNGKVYNLKDAMLEFVNSTGEGLGATGELVKNELIANLDVAMVTLKDMGTMMSSIGLTNYSNSSGIFKEEDGIDTSGSTTSTSFIRDVIKKQIGEFAKVTQQMVVESQVKTLQYGEKPSTQSFVFNESLVTITGNADMNTVAQLEKLAKQIEQNITSNIVSYIK